MNRQLRNVGSVFPARAGMSPDIPEAASILVCVPRASGDEPAVIGSRVSVTVCSPRERG